MHSAKPQNPVDGTPIVIPHAQANAQVTAGICMVGGSHAVESPSLSASTDGATPAYELKFLLTEAQALDVYAHLAGRMVADAHADPKRGFGYETTSIYCDTAQLDVFHRRGACKRRKHRVRRYGDAPWVFLERKSKKENRVRKRRSRVPDADLAFFAAAESAIDWDGHWFHQHVQRRLLAPVCKIAYDRVALVGHSADGPLRATFDRRIRGEPTSEWNVAPFLHGTALFTGHVICELKYQGFLPALFKEIIHDMQLTPASVSKYRAYMRTRGCIEGVGASDA